MRIKIVRLVFIFFMLAIGLDLVYVQAIRGNFYYHQSVNNRIRVIPLEGIRGRVLDRNGLVLAENRLAFNVALIPQDIEKDDGVFHYLSQVLKTDKKTLLQQFYQKRRAPFAPVVVAEDVDKKIAMALEENKYRFPGLYIQEEYRRYYPRKEIGAHVIGHVGKITRTKIEKMKDYGYTPLSIVGYSGVEEYYDNYLKGQEGGQQIEVNNRGQQVRLLSIREPQSGQDIQLTIDARIQQLAQESLGERKGVVVVMDFDSGEVLALASAPTYDPNIFVDSRLRKKVGQAMTDPDAPLLNRAIQGQYPPGSIFKTVVALAALAHNKISRHTTFHCPGYYTLGRRQFRCAHTHGDQDLIQGIAHSCNVYFFNTGLIDGPDLMSKYAKVMGLGQETHIDLPFEEKGTVPGRGQKKGWFKGDTLNFSIGQGDLLATPLQLVRLITTIGRGGQEVQPFLIKKIGDQEIVQLATVRILKIKDGIWQILQEGLRSAVTDPGGTGRLLNMDGFKVYGKTGTAQSIPGAEDHAWFVGYNLEGRRHVAFCVFLERGGSSYNAVVSTRDLLQRMKEEGFI